MKIKANFPTVGIIFIGKNGQKRHKLKNIEKTFTNCNKLAQSEKCIFCAPYVCSIKLYKMKTIKIREFEIATNIIAEVADIIAANELNNKITGTDEEQTVVFVEVHYDKDNEEERQAVHDIDDVINDYDEEDDEENEDDE
jgi:hypothetical protein